MKKKLISFSLVVIMLSLVTIFVGCGGKKEEAKKEANITVNKEEKEKAEIEKQKEEAAKKEAEKPKVNLVENKIGIPVLYYHSVNAENPKNDELVVTKDKFREQMTYLKDNGYTVITTETLYNYLSKGDKVPEKSIVITFDDGWKDNYQYAFPILKEFKYPATVFVITEMTKTNHWLYLSEAEIKEMSKEGMEIASHTIHHDNLTEIPKDKIKATLEESKSYLEGLIGKPVNTIAYPFGKYNKSVIQATKSAGYTMAFTINSGWANKENSPIYEIKRVYVNGHFDINQFKQRITNPNYNK